jgi:hypothetical protein
MQNKPKFVLDLMRSKAQVTIFFIIGIILLVIFVVAYLFLKNFQIN